MTGNGEKPGISKYASADNKRKKQKKETMERPNKGPKYDRRKTQG